MRDAQRDANELLGLLRYNVHAKHLIREGAMLDVLRLMHQVINFEGVNIHVRVKKHRKKIEISFGVVSFDNNVFNTLNDSSVIDNFYPSSLDVSALKFMGIEDTGNFLMRVVDALNMSMHVRQCSLEDVSTCGRTNIPLRFMLLFATGQFLLQVKKVRGIQLSHFAHDYNLFLQLARVGMKTGVCHRAQTP